MVCPWVLSPLKNAWSAYSNPIPKNKTQLLWLIVLCCVISIAIGLLLHIWLFSSLHYHTLLTVVLSSVVSTIIFFILVLMHPIRCIVTIMMPVMGTKQGRRLLLSSCFMLIAFKIIPNIIANMRAVFRTLGCLSQHSSERLLNSTFFFQTMTSDTNDIVTEMKNLLSSKKSDVKISAHTKTSLVADHILQITDNVKKDLMAVELLFKDGVLISNRILAGIFIMVLLFNATWYLKWYLTDLKFDNLYITEKLEKLALEKDGSHLLTASRVKLIRSTGLKLSRREIFHCIIRSLILVSFVMFTTVVIATDHITYQFALTVGEWVVKVPSVPIVFEIDYLITYYVLRGVFSKNHGNSRSFHWNMTFVSSQCRTQATPPDDSVAITVVIICGVIFAMILMEAYAQRLCRKISASFYKQREDQRVSYLFQKILQKQHKNVPDFPN
ncbi:osteoclast stimulatory transmembrane protein [Xenopus tropicalis]|nr:osteoclast stimulatory transmembrane protein [Xenopus tropicalis]